MSSTSDKTARVLHVASSRRNAIEGISRIEEIIEDFRQGKMVILVDDEDRENEGDLLIAAERVRPQDINFMAWHGRGLVCLTLTEERCAQLGLELMVSNNNARYSTNFTVSIEAAQGVTTGISAADRATTVRAAVKPDARPDDIATPGHIFPVMAKPGGVLTRAGHTEAGVDLARLAGLGSSSVICEVLKEDGSMARLPDLIGFGRTHGIRIGTIADLIRYRMENEPTVHRVEESAMATRYGEFRVFAYHDTIGGGTHLALVAGQPAEEDTVTVRVHVHNGVYDALSALRGEQAWTIDAAIERIANTGCGVLVLLQYDEGDGALVERIRRWQRQDMGIEPQEGRVDDLRVLGVGSQILADLGVRRMRVLGVPRRAHGLSGFGLEVVEYVSE